VSTNFKYISPLDGSLCDWLPELALCVESTSMFHFAPMSDECWLLVAANAIIDWLDGFIRSFIVS